MTRPAASNVHMVVLFTESVNAVKRSAASYANDVTPPSASVIAVRRFAVSNAIAVVRSSGSVTLDRVNWTYPHFRSPGARQSVLHRERREPDAAWLVRLLPECQEDHVPAARRLGPHATAKYASQACAAPRPRSGPGPPSLAGRFLCRAWAVQSGCCPCPGRSILSEVTPSTGEPDAGNPPVRFGGRGD